MKVSEKLMMSKEGLMENGAINIVIFGDSVSHGAEAPGIIDYEKVYWNRLRRMLNNVRNYVPVNMINSSIGGLSARTQLPRAEREVLVFNPDLVIVCFGLNDVNLPLEQFINPLSEIFMKCKEKCDVIFMTPNMLNTYVRDDVAPEHFEYAHKTAEIQNSGRMDEYMAAATDAARKCGVTVCDCYGEWKRMAAGGTDTTALLANGINHPKFEMHELFAKMLFDTIMGDTAVTAKTESTMYEEKK